jgi:hypothetical protein
MRPKTLMTYSEQAGASGPHRRECRVGLPVVVDIPALIVRCGYI